LEKREEQVLPGREAGGGGERKDGEGEEGEEITQTMYVHMNK
jgi:hypothetical protein